MPHLGTAGSTGRRSASPIYPLHAFPEGTPSSKPVAHKLSASLSQCWAILEHESLSFWATWLFTGRSISEISKSVTRLLPYREQYLN